MSLFSPRMLRSGETFENSYTNINSSETYLSMDFERNRVSIANSDSCRPENDHHSQNNLLKRK